MAHYGAVLHRSPAPMAVVGYYYPNGSNGKRVEIYRVLVNEGEYRRVCKKIKCCGGTMEQKDQKLFNHFKPKGLSSADVEIIDALTEFRDVLKGVKKKN